jgi:uncharacterized protein YuzE
MRIRATTNNLFGWPGGFGRRRPTALAHYDPETDVAVFKIRAEPSVRREEQPWEGVHEYSATGELVAVEIRFASAMLPPEILGEMPGPGVGTQGAT